MNLVVHGDRCFGCGYLDNKVYFKLANKDRRALSVAAERKSMRQSIVH